MSKFHRLRFLIAAVPAALLVLSGSPAGPQGTPSVIKFATLAPEGTSWMKVMKEFDRELQEKTSGRVKFKFYPGGRSGDEKDVVRKIRLGQLHAGGLTGVGLGEIAPEVRLLDAPFLFRDHAEVDKVLVAFTPDLKKALGARDMELLGWTEVGFVHLYTGTPVRLPEDMKACKMWVWEGDPIAEAAFKAFGVHPIPLALPDVMTSLQTGLINGVYTSHMAAVGLQWFTKTKYINAIPIAYSAGAVVVSKKSLDSLSPADRATLAELGARHMARLTQIGRQENRDALATLRKKGLILSEPPGPADLKRYEEIGRRSRRELAGRLFTLELLERVEAFLADLRAGRAPSSGGAPQKPPSKAPPGAKPKKG